MPIGVSKTLVGVIRMQAVARIELAQRVDRRDQRYGRVHLVGKRRAVHAQFRCRMFPDGGDEAVEIGEGLAKIVAARYVQESLGRTLAAKAGFSLA